MNDEFAPPAPDEAPAQRFGTTNRPVNVVVHRPPPTGWRRRLPGLFRAVEFGAILAVFAVAVPVVTFWYQSAYLPSTLPAGVTVTATLTELEEGPESSGFDDLTAYEAAIRVENPGDRRVTVIGAQYKLWGIHLARREEGAYEQDMAAEAGTCSYAFGGRYASEWAGPETLLATGRIFDGWWFDAGQDAEDHPLFFIPTGEFDVARLDVSVQVAKGDLVTQVDREPIDWSQSELFGATDEMCGIELAGDLSAEPLHTTSWEIRNQAPIVGNLFPDERLISVEWRPVGWVGEGATGSACDPWLFDESSEPCFPKLTIGADGADSWLEPIVSYCTSRADPETCQINWRLSLKQSLDLEREIGLSSSVATASIVLWPGGEPGPSPLQEVEFP